MGKVRVFIASSIDGFIAGPEGELDWLSGHEGVEDTFSPFLDEVGAILMGRRTYDAVIAFDGEWPYGETPLVVATTRPLTSSLATVRPMTGHIQELVTWTRELAGSRDVYVDGGAMIRSAMDAGLVDEMTVTLVPTVLGRGVPLFAGAEKRHAFDLLKCRTIGGGLVELKYASRR